MNGSLPPATIRGCSETGSPLRSTGRSRLKIRADWVVVLSDRPSETAPGTIVINLNQGQAAETPWMVKDYLKDPWHQGDRLPWRRFKAPGNRRGGGDKGRNPSRKVLIETLLGLARPNLFKGPGYPGFHESGGRFENDGQGRFLSEARRQGRHH